MKKTDASGKPPLAAMGRVIASLTLAWWLPLEITSAAEPGVVPTDPLPAQQQRTKFRLPPGFEIQLVVSEPQIGQPMNMNFDARGRLWLTHTIEYPYPAQGDVEPRSRFPGMGDHPPRDRLTVIEGIGVDGRPARVTHFAEGLNIPIGVTPLGSGDEALVYSIPRIDRVTDADGDGRADQRQAVFDGFGNIDTHGMINSFTRWIDGWVYGCHGFANTSTVRDGEGNVVTMQSGNTYRFRADGSRFQQFTWGQVNPFGMTFDPWGNLFNADCHSMPIYLLLRGAYYPSFGKPHDGLGFGPTMIDHGHGSTGICGPAYYAAEHFPEAFRGSVFICNPVNGQVHHDQLRQVGSTWLVETQPDFITCEDGWFRPVDLQVGPDGALYIADFYNSVIGHYEVPLDHPKRDRHHGRIWRVVYTGTSDDAAPQGPHSAPDLTTLSGEQLVEKLGDSNLVVRTLATNWLVDSTTPESAESRADLLRRVIAASESSASPVQQAHALWALERLATLSDQEVEQASRSSSDLVRTHLIRILAERQEWSPALQDVALRATADPSAMVRRVAADACGRHPHREHIEPLLQLVEQSPAGDTHLIHTAKIALRDQLRDQEILASLADGDFSQMQQQRMAELLVSIPRNDVAAWLLKHLKSQDADALSQEPLLRHIVRNASDNDFATLVDWLKQQTADDAEKAFRTLAFVREASAGADAQRVDALTEWASQLVQTLWTSSEPDAIRWSFVPHPQATAAGDPWVRQERPSEDGDATSIFWSSLPRGEQLMGTLRSSSFTLPPRLSFFMAGHNGITSGPEVPGNVVRLRDASTGKILREAKPPRHDVARRVEWDLSDLPSDGGWLELVDGHDGSGYAWLAVGRFSLPALNSDAFQPRHAAISLIMQFDLQQFQPRLRTTVSEGSCDPMLRQRAATALLHFRPDARLSTMLDALLHAESELAPTDSSGGFAESVFQLVVSREDASIYSALETMMRQGSRAAQNRWALQLSSGRRGGEALLRMINAGTASPRTVADPNVRNRLKALQDPALHEQLAEIEARMPEEDEETIALIRQRTQEFARREISLERGAKLFREQCAVCHRLDGQGELVGPQLEGVGARGLARLVEDVLDPNRNVDPAFRATAVLTIDGRVISGLVRHEDENEIELVDQAGKALKLPVDEVEQRTPLNVSPMPANFGDALDAQAFADLMAFLLDHRSADAATDDPAN